jgi:hypothetical protein
MRKWECGLRPIGAIVAYAPEGMRKWELIEVESRNAECGMRKKSEGEKMGRCESGGMNESITGRKLSAHFLASAIYLLPCSICFRH